MWCWAIIEEKTDRVVEEGYMMRKDAEREAQKMGDGFIVELIPM